MNKTKKVISFVIAALIASIVIFKIFPRVEISKSKNKLVTKENLASDPNIPLKDSIVNFGMKFLGTPYVTAGCSKEGFDCSGFVYFVFQHFNIEVPRSSVEFYNFGKEISIESVQKGDVLLFLSPTRDVIGHIGIVSRPNGKQSDFIHATSGREMKVTITNLANEGYTRRFVKAIRIL